MTRLDSKSVNFSVRVASSGQKKVVVSNLMWLDTPPFTSPQRARWRVTLKNMYSEPVRLSIGLWWYPWWMEGGWTVVDLAGFEERTIDSASRVPAEQGRVGAGINMHIGQWSDIPIYPSIGLSIQTLQRDSDLIPSGQPQLYSDWSGLKEFPVPASPYSPGLYISRIALPMLSRTKATQGKLEIRLLSPADKYQWKGSVCTWSPTEFRCGLTGMLGTPGPYQYSIAVYSLDNLMRPGLLWSIDNVALTDADPSGIYGFDMNFPATTKAIGSYPFAIRMKIRFAGELHPMFWGLNTEIMLMYPTVGYINVVN